MGLDMLKLKEIILGYPLREIDSEIHIINSFNKYDTMNDKLDYMLIEYEIDNGGELLHLYKVIKLVRLIRLPDTLKQATQLVAIHSQLLASFWADKTKFINILAKINDCGNDIPLGLMQIYGVQGVGTTIEEALREANKHFSKLKGALQGNYRTMEFRYLNMKEAEWLKEKMTNVKHLLVVRGIPQAKRASAERSIKGFGNTDTDASSEETSEQFVTALGEHDFITMTIATPVDYDVLESWLTQTSKKQTQWMSKMQGATGLSAGINIPIVFAANLGATLGYSDGYSEGHSYSHGTNQSYTHGTNESLSHSTGISNTHGISTGESLGHNYSINNSQSVGTNEGYSRTEGTSEGISNNISNSESHNIGYSENHSASYGQSSGLNEGVSSNHSVSQSEGYSHSKGVGESFNKSFSETHQTGESANYSKGYSHGESTGTNSSTSNSIGYGYSKGNNVSYSQGLNHSTSHGSNYSASVNSSTGYSAGGNVGIGAGEGIEVSGGVSGSKSHSSSSGESIGKSHSITNGTSEQHSVGINESVSKNSSFSTSSGISHGKSYSENESLAYSTSTGKSSGYNEGYSKSTNEGVSKSTSQSISDGIGANVGFSSNYSQSLSDGVGISESFGAGISKGVGTSWGRNVSDGHSTGVSTSQSKGDSEGINYGINKGENTSTSISRGSSYTKGTSESFSKGTSDSWSTSQGRNYGFSNSLSRGLSSSMGIGASVGISKTYQFLDVEVKNIVELLEFQVNRLKQAIEGHVGAFYTDMYIGTFSEEAKDNAKSAAKFAWFDDKAKICPLQVLEIKDKTEFLHLLQHFNAFSSCPRKERDFYGHLESYKYSTILTSVELTAYTHPVRITDGGIFADIQNVPELSVPAEMKGEIYMGKIVSGYKWTMENGYITPHDYRIDGKHLMHTLFAASSRSGKTVAAIRYVTEIANNVIRERIDIKNGIKQRKRMRVVILDAKRDWRNIATLIDVNRFRFYSMDTADFYPFLFNPLKVPLGIPPEVHLDTIVDVFCRAYGLGVRSVLLLTEAIKNAYENKGVFSTNDPYEIKRLSGEITMKDVYTELCNLEKNIGRDKMESLEKVKDRVYRYTWDNSILCKLYSNPQGMSIDELLGKDDVIVIESGAMQSNNMVFLFGLLTASLYRYAKYLPNYFLGEDQYETLLVIEEANKVLTGDTSDNENGIKGQSIFEEMMDQAAGLGLYVTAITQEPSKIPSSIIANCHVTFAGKLRNEKDIDTIMIALGKEPRYDDRNLKKFFPKMPIGWFVTQTTRTYDYKQAEPVLIKVEPLEIPELSNSDLDNIIKSKLLN